MQLILNFHGIGECTRPYEPDERPYWLAPTEFETILDVALEHAEENQISYTFDDGNRSDLTIALPALSRRGLQGRFFVLSEKINQPGYLTSNDLHALVDAGMIIGTHGAGHRDWRRVSNTMLEAEIFAARKTISEVINQQVDEASIPFGSYDRRVVQCLRRAGYRTVYSSDGGMARDNAWFKPRETIQAKTTLAALSSLLSQRWNLGRIAKHQTKLFIKQHR